ncbi:MAG: ComF family protein [Ruminococcus sp.]|nr:ComF family protein [Ruminococcus sp.]
MSGTKMEISERKFTFRDKIKNALFPERCPYCTRVIPLGDLCCDDCAEKFNSITYHTYARGGFYTVSAVPYTDIFAEAIKRFKFNNSQQYAYQLARVMADAIVKEYKDEEFDMITFVPLHPVKLRERGYNQSELLATELSRLSGIPVVTALKKTRNNQPQHTQKKASQRESNVKGVYRLTDKRIAEGKRILLIDDIITTGNTLGECGRILVAGGAEKVLCATFAVTVVKTT